MIIRILILFLLSFSLFCNNNKKIIEGCKNLEDEPNFFYIGAESEKEVDLITKDDERELQVRVESIFSKNPPIYILLNELSTAIKYRLYYSKLPPISIGGSYKIYNKFEAGIFSPEIFYKPNLLKIYSESGEMLFANSTGIFKEDLLQDEGILVEKISALCPLNEITGGAYKNIALEFSCVQETLTLFQGEEGLLNCNGKTYLIHVNVAWVGSGEDQNSWPLPNPNISWEVELIK